MVIRVACAGSSSRLKLAVSRSSTDNLSFTSPQRQVSTWYLSVAVSSVPLTHGHLPLDRSSTTNDAPESCDSTRQKTRKSRPSERCRAQVTSHVPSPYVACFFELSIAGINQLTAGGVYSWRPHPSRPQEEIQTRNRGLERDSKIPKHHRPAAIEASFFPSSPRNRSPVQAEERGNAVAVGGHHGVARVCRGLPRPPVRGCQSLRHPCQEGHDHAERHPVGPADSWKLGRSRLLNSIED